MRWMSKYVLIQSKSPWESSSVADFYAVARQLAAAGHEVTLFLVQNAALAARREARDPGLAEVVGTGVQVLVDDFSLRERGIDGRTLARGVTPCAIDAVVDHLASGAKSMWN
jgi:predicted peroxiredoxin